MMTCKYLCLFYISGYYPEQQGGYKSVANMSVLQEKQQRRRSQPDILDSNDTGFYTSNYSSSNYTANYSSNPSVSETRESKNCKSPTSDKSGWKSSKSYAMVPRMGRRASRDMNSKYSRDSSRPANKKDYQDVYKDRKEEKSKSSKKNEPTRMISMDTGAIITGMPTVPTRKYSREDDYAAYEELIVEEAPPKLAPISGLLSQVNN